MDEFAVARSLDVYCIAKLSFISRITRLTKFARCFRDFPSRGNHVVLSDFGRINNILLTD
jgi:hypothetical protein